MIEWRRAARALGRALGIGAVLVSGAATAQVPAGDAAWRQLADQIAGQGAVTAGIPRLIVGISQHGHRAFFAYTGTGAPPLAPDSVVEIGSITKVFTGALLAQAIDRGAIDPAQSIQAYLPGTPLQPCTARITTIQLADFASGLPRMPSDLPEALQQRGIDRYTPRDFLRWLSTATPRTGCNLPAPYLYSNASVGLLGPILANATHRPWQALIADEITGPLGMVDTAVAPARPQVEGTTATGPAPRWPVFAWYAAGALRSTARDMLSFGEAALGHGAINGRAVPPALLQAFRHAMLPIYTQADGDGVGLSWESRADGGGGTMTFKNGGTAGFSSAIVVDPAKDCAIFVVANKAEVPAQPFAIRMMRAIAP